MLFRSPSSLPPRKTVSASSTNSTHCVNRGEYLSSRACHCGESAAYVEGLERGKSRAEWEEWEVTWSQR